MFLRFIMALGRIPIDVDKAVNAISTKGRHVHIDSV